MLYFKAISEKHCWIFACFMFCVYTGGKKMHSPNYVNKEKTKWIGHITERHNSLPPISDGVCTFMMGKRERMSKWDICRKIVDGWDITKREKGPKTVTDKRWDMICCWSRTLAKTGKTFQRWSDVKRSGRPENGRRGCFGSARHVSNICFALFHRTRYDIVVNIN